MDSKINKGITITIIKNFSAPNTQSQAAQNKNNQSNKPQSNQNKPNLNSQSKPDLRNVQCFHCGKYGHIKANCRNLNKKSNQLKAVESEEQEVKKRS